MTRQILLLADEENKFLPTSVSRRSLSGLQYNSSIDSRDTDPTTEGERLEVAEKGEQPTLLNTDKQQSPPFAVYNVSNDEELLIFGLSPQLDSESDTDDDNKEFVASDMKLEQQYFEDTEKGQAEELSTTTATTTSTTTARDPFDLEDSYMATTSLLPYVYSCDGFSTDVSDGSNNNSKAAPTSSSTTASSLTGGTSRESFQIEKQVIRYDYDLLVASMASTSAEQQPQAEKVHSMVHQFEKRLLMTVGLELSKNNVNISLFCDGAVDADNVLQLQSSIDDLPVVSGRERRGEGRAMLLHQNTLQSSLPESVVTLSKLSSLPADEILNGE